MQKRLLTEYGEELTYSKRTIIIDSSCFIERIKGGSAAGPVYYPSPKSWMQLQFSLGLYRYVKQCFDV